MVTGAGLIRKLSTLAVCGAIATSHAEEQTKREYKEPKLSPNLMTTLKSADKYERVSEKSSFLGN